MMIEPSNELTYHSIFFNTLRPRQNGRHLLDNIFQMDFLDEKCMNFD